eukprot:TRINITY_DN6954_c0_g1_i2.p1 TRINITY_DN6954_c0_g1~~TRINITY_DN6954_c0_g1_i2.p1  ORF type:complete len:474 (+),score=-46.42 TRINITY_DN6954_c0_g1_i2:42-1463(+)
MRFPAAVLLVCWSRARVNATASPTPSVSPPATPPDAGGLGSGEWMLIGAALAVAFWILVGCLCWLACQRAEAPSASSRMVVVEEVGERSTVIELQRTDTEYSTIAESTDDAAAVDVDTSAMLRNLMKRQGMGGVPRGLSYLGPSKRAASTRSCRSEDASATQMSMVLMDGLGPKGLSIYGDSPLLGPCAVPAQRLDASANSVRKTPSMRKASDRSMNSSSPLNGSLSPSPSLPPSPSPLGQSRAVMGSPQLRSIKDTASPQASPKLGALRPLCNTRSFKRAARASPRYAVTVPCWHGAPFFGLARGSGSTVQHHVPQFRTQPRQGCGAAAFLRQEKGPGHSFVSADDVVGGEEATGNAVGTFTARTKRYGFHTPSCQEDQRPACMEDNAMKHGAVCVSPPCPGLLLHGLGFISPCRGTAPPKRQDIARPVHVHPFHNSGSTYRPCRGDRAGFTGCGPRRHGIFSCVMNSQPCC